MENLSKKERKAVVLQDKFFKDFKNITNALTCFIAEGGVNVDDIITEFNKKNEFKFKESIMFKDVGKKIDGSKWLILRFDGRVLRGSGLTVCDDDNQRQLILKSWNSDELTVEVLDKGREFSETFNVVHITNKTIDFSIKNDELVEQLLDLSISALDNVYQIFEEFYSMISEEREGIVRSVITHLM